MTKQERARIRFDKNPRRQEVITMRLEGATYKEVGEHLGISRQRAEQLGSPPKDTIEALITRSSGRCEMCGLFVRRSGHAHHKGSAFDTYEDIGQLLYLCISCHRHAHNGERATKRPCAQCGKDYTREESQSPRWCSAECRAAYLRVSLVCDECGIAFKRKASEVRARLAQSGQKRIFCSGSCRGKWTAKNHGFGAAGGKERLAKAAETRRLRKRGSPKC